MSSQSNKASTAALGMILPLPIPHPIFQIYRLNFGSCATQYALIAFYILLG